MREYGKIYTSIWSDHEFNPLHDESKILLIYLLTSQHTNMLGCFRLPDEYITTDLNWDKATVSKRFDELFRNGFVNRFETPKYVLVHNFLKFNRVENPNQGKAIEKIFNLLPHKNHEMLAMVADEIIKHVKFIGPEFRSKLETLSKPFRNQKQKQEQEQKQDKVKTIVELEIRPRGAVDQIFDHWRQAMDHQRSALDAKRRRRITTALKTHTLEQCLEAIDGCAKTPFNMGDNDRGQRYDSIDIIFRDADHVDRFIANNSNPPVNKRKETFDERNARILEEGITMFKKNKIEDENENN